MTLSASQTGILLSQSPVVRRGGPLAASPAANSRELHAYYAHFVSAQLPLRKVGPGTSGA